MNCPPGVVEPNGELASTPVSNRLERQVGRVVVQVVLDLPAVVAHALAEIALAVKQSEAGEREATIARRFEMVPGKHAQSAGMVPLPAPASPFGFH